MDSIGEQLRGAREARGVTLEDAERQTRIRAKLLAALEAEDFAAFASLTQARGFLRNYAEYLDLDADALLAGLTPSRSRARPVGNGRAAPRPAAAQNGRPPVRGGWRRIFTRDLVVGVLVTALVAVVLIWGALQLWASLAAPATPTATRAAVSVAGTPATALPSATPTVAASPTAALPTPRPNYVGVNVVVRAEQRLWLRALVDGAETFVGQMAPGETREFVGNTVVELWTGNGRGTRVVFNGQDQGTLGVLGEVVIRLWTLAGAVTPTPTATATP